jgi:hypothetical protein
MIAMTALYFRYRRIDRRLAPTVYWDIMLWLAVILISIVASYAVVKSTLDLVRLFG